MQVSSDLEEFKMLFARKFPQEQPGRRVLKVVVDEHDQVETLFDLIPTES